MKPSAEAKGEYGSQIPKAMMDTVVTVSAKLARLCSLEEGVIAVAEVVVLLLERRL